MVACRSVCRAVPDGGGGADAGGAGGCEIAGAGTATVTGTGAGTAAVGEVNSLARTPIRCVGRRRRIIRGATLVERVDGDKYFGVRRQRWR